MGLGCPGCGTVDGSNHAKDCTWQRDHPTVGHIIVYEYAGFNYSVKHMFGSEPEVTPLSDQHPAASKAKHIAAAREMYLDDWNAGRIEKHFNPAPITDAGTTPATSGGIKPVKHS